MTTYNQPNKNTLIFHIIDLEWRMFDAVQHVNGRAPCQDEQALFYIMRYSQHQAFSEEFHRAYLADLKTALAEGRNLITEKYAYMMETTDPEDFLRHIKPHLPSISPVKQGAVDVCLHLLEAQEADARQQLPSLSKKARPEKDAGRDVSALTYMAGELKTYSLGTLQACARSLEASRANHINVVADIYRMTQSFYGNEERIFQLRHL